MTTPQQGIRRQFTWRKSLIGGGLAFAGLGVVATGYMVMRLLGIGPAGTLVTTGVLEEQGRIIVADFENRTSDSTLGPSVTEALRIDLAQSPVLRLVEVSEIASVLQRMDRDPATPLDLRLASEVAEREGIKAVVTGEVAPLGRGYVLSARLVSVADGQALVALRETAADDGEIISAVDRLSGKLRERIGESLKTIRANEPLSEVTTASLEALRRYSQAVQAFEVEEDYEKAVLLLEEAVALDTAFAMAYRKLAVALGNMQVEPARMLATFTKAFEYRNRLPDYERYFTAASYYATILRDDDKAIAEYQTLLNTYPNDFRALNNLGVVHAYGPLRNWEKAEELFLRATEEGPHSPITHQGTVAMALALGKLDDAEARLEQMVQRFSDNPTVLNVSVLFAGARREYVKAEEFVRSLRETQRGNLRWRAISSSYLADLARVRGKLADARRHVRDKMRAEEERGLLGEYLETAVDLARLDTEFTGSSTDGLQQIDLALERYPLDSLAAGDPPYLELAYLYARAGRHDQARVLLSQYESEIDEEERRANPFRFASAGAIALADGRAEDAVAEFRSWDGSIGCPVCALPDLAKAYDQAAQPDSAVAVYERFVTTPWLWGHLNVDSWNLATSYKRLGELYEEQGDRENAVEYYDKFVELWANADPELQPVVADVRARIAQLVGER